jgi:hypothetical protein
MKPDDLANTTAPIKANGAYCHKLIREVRNVAARLAMEATGVEKKSEDDSEICKLMHTVLTELSQARAIASISDPYWALGETERRKFEERQLVLKELESVAREART